MPFIISSNRVLLAHGVSMSRPEHVAAILFIEARLNKMDARIEARLDKMEAYMAAPTGSPPTLVPCRVWNNMSKI